MITIASLLQIMNQVGSLDSSRDLQPFHVKSFVNRLHLVLHACVEIFDVTFFYVYSFMGWERALLNSQSSNSVRHKVVTRLKARLEYARLVYCLYIFYRTERRKVLSF